jgi:NADPH2:quinone reductase
MNLGYVTKEIGNWEAIKKVKFKEKPLEPGMVRIEQHFFGVSYYDVAVAMGETGLESPFTNGVEACGKVVEVNDNDTSLRVGDKVVYCTGAIGAHMKYRDMPSTLVVRVPEDIKLEEVCGFFLKGHLALSITNKAYKVRGHETILINAAAGGTATILAQMLSQQKLKIYGSAGGRSKVMHAKKNGFIDVVDSGDQHMVRKLVEFTYGRGFNAIFDGVGKTTFKDNISLLSTFGLLLQYGFASGNVKEMDGYYMQRNSVFLTFPSLSHYKYSRDELEQDSNTLFDLRRKNIIKNNITRVYNFDELPTALKDMAERKTMGSVVIKV